jgi:hypothetical protein
MSLLTIDNITSVTNRLLIIIFDDKFEEGRSLVPKQLLVAFTVIGAGLCMQWRYVEYSFRCPYCGWLNNRKYSLPADSEQDAAGTVTTKTHLCDQCEVQLTADSPVNFSRNDPMRKDS